MSILYFFTVGSDFVFTHFRNFSTLFSFCLLIINAQTIRFYALRSFKLFHHHHTQTSFQTQKNHRFVNRLLRRFSQPFFNNTTNFLLLSLFSSLALLFSLTYFFTWFFSATFGLFIAKLYIFSVRTHTDGYFYICFWTKQT